MEIGSIGKGFSQGNKTFFAHTQNLFLLDARFLRCFHQSLFFITFYRYDQNWIDVKAKGKYKTKGV
ncbi:hypothetical protein V6Z11_A07G072100 [Gossypium hirsutum]